ncbi:MAG: glycine cleavage system protein H [Novosphingobium sp. 28-62-57]|uniref:glycine cleavage system protein GcvH n=1 Tax=unclassified Novosphingobium TaxID=2644732 RepID=UPI000BDD2CAA|nr:MULTISPECIES: glycine cleavage system protein GcvH [unclassified Novosphingobium]OYW49720.1 MAG: glycine cleavage system protein H [Novosphingobium sp. 12-62-10]OYZ12324.1 MAG: glycine cleavage system protein H [Novosphingobium sp. 28-62-57]OYZ45433.1 MAG: glycine cleavage system protein H [Novosphingobium sp. 16-62-11]OYZ97520.1 MAG: glycine cleavage system protein H [Novosphingobium sp. 17-62-8]
MTRYFTKDHEWIAVEGSEATVGITDYAQSQLGDITFVEVPGEGSEVSMGDSASVVDSVKAASDVYAPVSGKVTVSNAALEDQPELVNTDPEGDGWLWKMTLSDPAELDGLMDEASYQAFIAEL